MMGKELGDLPWKRIRNKLKAIIPPEGLELSEEQSLAICKEAHGLLVEWLDLRMPDWRNEP